MSLSPENQDTVEVSPFGKSGLDRRTMLRRAAAASLVAVPGLGLLDACATGGSGGSTPTSGGGAKSKDNPLGVDPKAPLEVIIFAGGYKDKYATDIHVPMYKKAFPNADVKESSTQEISTTLQPRFSGGTPPDVVDNSGTKSMDFGTLVDGGQLQDLTELWDAPSVDDANKKVRDTIQAGTIEIGLYSGKPFVFNYVSTVYGLWYNAKLWASKGWQPASTWTDFVALLDKIKGAGITPIGYAGANASYYMYRVILTSAAKIGGADLLKSIDNLEANAWTNDAVHKAAEAWGSLSKYSDKSFLGLKHTEVQLKQNQDKVAIYPSGNWLESEQKDNTPATFEYAMMPEPAVTTSDKLPATSLYLAAGEPFFVSAKGKNPKGGMEYFRRMLSKEGAQGFTKTTGSLTVVMGASEGLDLPPGLKSSSKAAAAAGSNSFYYLFDSWYNDTLEKELRSATNELFYQGGNADKFVARMQKKADAIKADSSIKKFTR